MNRKTKALALFSGGLDSVLAIKVMQEQGVEVIALNFTSYFFGGKNIRADKMAEQLGVKLEYIDFQERHLAMMKNPIYGMGKNMNPCIDCHSLMFKIAGELLKDYNADFIISGEVLGQRPMSQNAQALEKVKKLSGVGDLIVRPLSGKLLPPTLPMEKGLVDREKLLDIQGRSRQRQLQLVTDYQIIEYETPGGGCLLTDPAYSLRLRILKDDNFFQDEYSYLFKLIKKARFFRFECGKYLFVGRDDESNKIISSHENKGFVHLKTSKVPGPRIMLFGNFSKSEEKLIGEIFSRYSKVKGKEAIEVNIVQFSNKENNLIRDEKIIVEPIDLNYIEEQIKKYQIT
ncbi:tRNA (5-methylaminomethyl-2-thiouridylate)-methyltransferase [Fusobacterium sp. PH5-44]|uniref:tRNA (5-methylaminomethyl-2-thiouridylate)-methyltransferase n=1 Tax=unclassified Fusobacterium TaxID=2648384 RepID=UPI003D215BAC